MSDLRKIVEAHPDRAQLIADYEKFEEDGAIGDCELRNVAAQWNSSPILIMQLIAMEAYRAEYHRMRDFYEEI